MLDVTISSAPSFAVDAAPLRRRLSAAAAWLSAPPTPEMPLPLRGAAVRVLSLGAAMLLGAALLYGAPAEATLRRHACAVADCATPSAPSTGLTAGRGAVGASSSTHP